MTNGKTKWIELAIRLAFVAAFVVGGGLLLSRGGHVLTLTELGGLALLGAAIAGIEIRKWRNGGGPSGGSAIAGGAGLLLIATMFGGCGAHLPQCSIERATVNAMQLGVSAADTMVPDDAEHRDAIHYAKAATSLGSELVDACEESDPDRGEVAWQSIALAALRGVLKVVGMATSERSDAAPEELERAIAILEDSGGG